jgi:hypothetical protein
MDDIPDLDDSYSIGQKVRILSSGKIGTIVGHPNDYEIKLEDGTTFSGKSHLFEKVLDPNNKDDQAVAKDFILQQHDITKKMVCLQSLCFQLNELKQVDTHNVNYIKALHNIYKEFDILYDTLTLQTAEPGSFFYDFLQEYLKYKSNQLIQRPLKGGVKAAKLFGILALLLTITPNLCVKIVTDESVKNVAEHFYPAKPSVLVRMQTFLTSLGFSGDYVRYLVSFFTTPYTFMKLNAQGICGWNAESFMASKKSLKRMAEQFRNQYSGLRHRIIRRHSRTAGIPYSMGVDVFHDNPRVMLTHGNFYSVLERIIANAQRFLRRQFRSNECIVLTVTNSNHSFNMIVNATNVAAGCIADANGFYTTYEGLSCTTNFDTGSAIDIPRFRNLRQAFNAHSPFFNSTSQNNMLQIEDPDTTYYTIVTEAEAIGSIQESYDGAGALLQEFYFNSSASLATDAEMSARRQGGKSRKRRTKKYTRKR